MKRALQCLQRTTYQARRPALRTITFLHSNLPVVQPKPIIHSKVNRKLSNHRSRLSSILSNTLSSTPSSTLSSTPSNTLSSNTLSSSTHSSNTLSSALGRIPSINLSISLSINLSINLSSTLRNILKNALRSILRRIINNTLNSSNQSPLAILLVIVPTPTYPAHLSPFLALSLTHNIHNIHQSLGLIRLQVQAPMDPLNSLSLIIHNIIDHIQAILNLQLLHPLTTNIPPIMDFHSTVAP
ncbi:hypothetical protein CFO_g3047 [Ceratocystis platani]|uniref:Uncharacterized protein n=1 Tax=Ceratocystis fimbriata f. sp. platani TaxID=88771 RepID=A0A0F8B0S6_CERFI|nr:hypothetical protein CFO_g3047 [Ceratocystis platani]